MKKVFFAIALLSALTGKAQIKSYKDSTFMQPYSLLSGATSLNSGLFWDDPDFTIPIGFTFKFFGDSTNTLYHSADFGTGGQFLLKPFTPTTQFFSFIAMIGSDLRDRDTTNSGSSKSPISYQTTGTAPNRIFKLQFRNAGFVNAIDNGNYQDSLSIQLWLHETSNMIDVRFGPGNLVSSAMDLWDGGPGPFIGIFDSVNYQSLNLSVKKSYFLNGTVTAPVIDSSITAFATLTTLPGMSGTPANGRVYRFMPRKASGTATALQETVSQANATIQVDRERQEVVFNTGVKEAKIALYDLNGRPVFETVTDGNSFRYNMRHLDAGMYIARWHNNQEQQSLKVIKSN